MGATCASPMNRLLRHGIGERIRARTRSQLKKCSNGTAHPVDEGHVRTCCEDELEHIFAWIAQDNSRAALEVVARLAKRLHTEHPTGITSSSNGAQPR